jgi:hypothetical protein
VLAHVDEAETAVRKPLLLEEFGKKLSALEYVNGSIGGKRDPIFRSMYRTVEDAIAAYVPLCLCRFCLKTVDVSDIHDQSCLIG